MTRLGAFWRDRRGVAAIEFAFVSLFLYGVLVVGLDFGVYAQQKLKLGAAVEQAAVLAYNTQVGSSTTAISNYVQNGSGTMVQPAVAIACNGTSTCGDGKCSCLTTGGVTSFAVASCNSVCAGSTSIAGNYLKIVATVPYSAVVVPDRYLGGRTIIQSAVVRLQ